MLRLGSMIYESEIKRSTARAAKSALAAELESMGSFKS